MIMERIFMAIFAKLGTTEKVIMPVFENKTPEVMRSLNSQFGGDWVYCEKLKPGEGIKFNDTQPYRGFSPNIERYSDAIIQYR
jgi:hypothetical protein